MGKEQNGTQSESSALSYHTWSCGGGLKKHFQDLAYHSYPCRADWSFFLGKTEFTPIFLYPIWVSLFSLQEEPKPLESMLKNQMKWSHVPLVIIGIRLLSLLLRKKLKLCNMSVFTLQITDMQKLGSAMAAKSLECDWHWWGWQEEQRTVVNDVVCSCGLREDNSLYPAASSRECMAGGWHAARYVLPHIAFGPEALRLYLSPWSLTKEGEPQRMLSGMSFPLLVLV